MYYFHYHRRCWPTFIQFLPTIRCTRDDVPRTEDVGLPTKCRLNDVPASQPIAGSMLVYCLRRWPYTNPSLGLLYTLPNTRHLSNDVSMLTHSLRRWPDIETALGDNLGTSNVLLLMFIRTGKNVNRFSRLLLVAI